MNKLPKKDRKNEKGSAIISVLLISVLLLSTLGALIMVATVNTANVTDALSEQQAYYAAESGLQTALNILRGNKAPNSLINTSVPATNKENQIDFKKAVTLATSNYNADSATSARLSRWIIYNYTPSGAAEPDRVALTSSYTPLTGMAFAITAIDPDAQDIVFNTTGIINKGTNTIEIVNNAGNKATITFVPNTENTGNIPLGTAKNVSFGSFQVTSTGGSGIDINQDIPFEIAVNMMAPLTATRIIRGKITSGTITNSSIGTVKIDFLSKVYNLAGSEITLNNDPLSFTSVNGTTQINGTITSSEPRRLILRSTGFGPRGAQKQLEVIIQNNIFNNLDAPATLTLIGSSPDFAFAPGNSAVVQYSGDDANSSMIVPAIGVTNPANLTSVENKLSIFKGTFIGPPADVSKELPEWLQSTTNIHETLTNLKNIAQSSGGYFASGVTPPNFGNNAAATGITFCDGDVSLSKSGGGILVVTGKLILNGGVDFNGLIIVTGAGGLQRNGGGGGTLQGNVIVAPYNPANLSAGFLSPKYDISGGGNSSLIFNSSSSQNGISALKSNVLGVAEK